MRSRGSRQSLVQLIVLWSALVVFVFSHVLSLPSPALAQVTQPDPNACTEATTAEASKAGLTITLFNVRQTAQGETGIDLKFITPKTATDTPKAFVYYRDAEGKRTDIPNVAVRGPFADGDDNLWDASLTPPTIPVGTYTFHTTVLAKIEGVTKRACAKKPPQEVTVNCGTAEVDRPFDKSKSLLRSVGRGNAVNQQLEFVRYATDGSSCTRKSGEVSFPNGKKFRISTTEGDDTQLRSNTFYSMYEMLSNASVGGEDYHFYAAVDKEAGILGDVVARKFRGEGNDENEVILSWRLAEKNGIVVTNNRLKTLLGNLHEMAGTKVQGYITGKLREITINADFDIDYTGSEAATKNPDFSGTKTTLPTFQTAEAEMQLWCAYDGHSSSHLFIAAHKFALPANPSDGKWTWKTNVYSGSCIVTSFLTLTNDGTVPLAGGTPNYTGHGLTGINTERSFEDAVGTSAQETTEAIYLGLIDRGREDLFAADQQFAVDKDETKAIPALNPKFTHRATTTDVLGGIDPCNLLALVGVASSKGIGAMLLQMVSCLAKQIILPVIESLQDYFLEGANYSQLPPIGTDSNHALARAPVGEQIKSFFVPTAHAQSKQVGFEGHLQDPNGVIVTIWKLARSLLNIVVIFALLAIAFANIFHINMNTYAAKKMLPGLVIGVVGANASLLIVRFLADVVQAVSQLVLDLGGYSSVGTLLSGFLFSTGYNLIIASFSNIITAVLAPLIIIGLIIVAIYYVFLLIALMFAMLKRVVMLFFLTMISPLAFAAYGVPQFQSYFYKWWDTILRQLFVWPVLLFGMMMTVKISEAVNLAGGSLLDMSGFVKMMLILGAAHFTLHLPKTMTKGAIDLVGMLKKATATAPHIAGAARGAYGQYADEKLKRDKKRLAAEGAGEALKLRGSGDRVGAKRVIADYRARQLLLEDKVKRRKDRLGGLHGYAQIFGNPDMVKDAYQNRIERAEKTNKIAGLTKAKLFGSSALGHVRGKDAEAELAKKLAIDELKDARTNGDLKDWADTLGKGHLKAVEEELGIKQAMFDAAGDDAGELERLRQKAANLKSREEVDDFLKDLSARTGKDLRLKSVKNYHDVMKWSGYQSAVTRVARGIRTEEERDNPDTRNAQKVSRVAPDYSLFKESDDNQQNTDSDGGTDGAAYAGASQRGFTGVDPAIAGRMAEEGLQNWVRDVFSHSKAVAPHLNEELEGEIRQSLQGLGGIDLDAAGSTTELERLRTALVGASGGNFSGGGENRLTKQVLDASGRDLLKVAEQVLQAGEVNRRGGTQEAASTVAHERFNQSAGLHNQATETLATIDYDRLTESIDRGINIGDAIVSQLGPELEKMAVALGKNLTPESMGRIAQEFNKVNVEQFRAAISGRDRRSLASVLKNTMETNMVDSVSRGLNTHVIAPGEMIFQPSEPGVQPPPTEG